MYKLKLPLTTQLWQMITPNYDENDFGQPEEDNISEFRPLPVMTIQGIRLKDMEDKPICTFYVKLFDKIFIYEAQEDRGVILVDSDYNLFTCKYLCSKPNLVYGRNVVSIVKS